MKFVFRQFFLGVFLAVFTLSQYAGAVNTSQIERVRNKGVLDTTVDYGVIDAFVAQAVEQMLDPEQVKDIEKIRSVIVANSKSNTPSSQVQYQKQFSKSTYNYISKAVKNVSNITDQQIRFKIALNLLILMDDLKDAKLSSLAVNMLGDQNVVIRYWAVRAVTNLAVVEQLKINPVLVNNIIKQLSRLAFKTDPEMLLLMVNFTDQMDSVEGKELLLKIADIRIKSYENWTVQYELMDSVLLKALCKKMVLELGIEKARFAQNFAQLYSYAIERYLKGKQLLDDASRGQLVSVIAETERMCISEKLKIYQKSLRDAVESDDVTALLVEHSKLLGDSTRAGKLSEKISFDYGKNADGTSRVEPKVLSDPPLRVFKKRTG